MKKILPHLYPVISFAKKKGVSKQAVWKRIDKGDIKPVLVGTNEDHYIDWRKYHDFKFEKANKINSPKKTKAKK